jgi:hypothetical protein
MMLDLRPRTPLLVEGCAGMAAVSWAAFGMVPPVKYQGGKRGYAADILRHLWVWRPKRIVLVEADPWVAAALRVCWDAGLRATAREVYAVAARDDEAGQRVRWERLRLAMREGRMVPTDPDAGIWWLWMRPRTVPFRVPHEAVAGDWMGQATVVSDRARNAGQRVSHWALDAPSASLGLALPEVRVEVVCAPIQTVEPVAGAVLYLDPPYQGTAGYAVEAGLDRAAVEDVARRWVATGATVGISETEAVEAGPGARREVLRRRGSSTRPYSLTAEVLTVYGGGA